MKKYWALLGIALVAIVAGWWYLGTNGEENGREIFEVQRQDLTEIIAEVGKVVPVKEISLTFPLTGQIAQIHVSEGQTVAKGDLLAELDSAKTNADLANAQASVQEAQARLDKIYSGASSYEVQVAQTAVTNAENNLRTIELAAKSSVAQAEANVSSAEVMLESAEKYLLDQESKTNDDLTNSYEDGLDTLNSSLTKIDTAIKRIDYTRDKYFDTNSNSYDIKVKSREQIIDNEYEHLIPIVEAAILSDEATITLALDEMIDLLYNLSDVLAYIREAQEDKVGIHITEEDKSLIDVERSNIDIAISNVTAAIQAISSKKLNNDIALNNAQSSLNEAEAALEEAKAALPSVSYDWDSKIAQSKGELQLARDRLSLEKAPARSEDIALYKAQVSQAVAYVDLIKQNLLDTELKSPIAGLVTDIYTEVGELADLTSPVLAMIAEDNFQVESFISELDIAGVKLADPVEMEFDAFGKDRVFTGTILSINPYETIMDGDIFYKVTIDFDEYDANLRSGMTADIRIMTEDKDSILVVPSRYVGDDSGSKYVKIPIEGAAEGEESFKLQEITIGLKGINMIEVISGLDEGDKIIPYY